MVMCSNFTLDVTSTKRKRIATAWRRVHEFIVVVSGSVAAKNG